MNKLYTLSIVNEGTLVPDAVRYTAILKLFVSKEHDRDGEQKIILQDATTGEIKFSKVGKVNLGNNITVTTNKFNFVLTELNQI